MIMVLGQVKFHIEKKMDLYLTPTYRSYFEMNLLDLTMKGKAISFRTTSYRKKYKTSL